MNVGQPVTSSSRAVVALVLGILGIVLCPLSAPVAWVLGKRAEEEIDASGGTIDGRGMATAGKITGIIGVGLLVLYMLILLVVVVFIGLIIDEGSSSSFTETVQR